MRHACTLLKPGGQILFDSSDIAYLYEGDLPQGETYYGELRYRYEYKGHMSDWFNWLYVDQQTMSTVAQAEGWNFEVLFEDGYDQYLARLTKGVRTNRCNHPSKSV